MSVTAAEVERRYPIHWLVWHNRYEELAAAVSQHTYTPEELELKDPRGRTPLLLAVTLGYVECVRALIDAGADVNCEKDGWTAVQEATATGNPELLSVVLTRRDGKRESVRAAGIPQLLQRLSLAPDFYVEMKWEFTSWVPLVSRMCPFDTYKVYKRGANVRVDTTLLGFENNRWQRGNHTYIFRGQGTSASFVELDHEGGTSWEEFLKPLDDSIPGPPPREASIAQRLASPLAINYLDTDKISFERNKSGIWGWRQDKTENVNGYECKVFNANNVELVSKTRTEHLPKGAKTTLRTPALAGLLSLADNEPASPLLTPDKEESPRSSKSADTVPQEPVSWDEYFADTPLDKDIGKPKELSTKVQKFKATLWLCEDYPLQLQEQIMPILDLMAAISSPHFAKLKDFVQMQLPSGFPVKIEIPLFHVLNARITFGNIFATETPVTYIETIQEGDRLSCIVDDKCFDIGRGYTDMRGRTRFDDEEGLLQYAIQQSLMEAGTHDDQSLKEVGTPSSSDDSLDDQVDVWEALRGARPTTPQPTRESPLLALEERELQRAIEASLASLTIPPGAAAVVAEDVEDEELALAAVLAISAKEQARIDQQLAHEQRQLEEALRLSLLDD